MTKNLAEQNPYLFENWASLFNYLCEQNKLTVDTALVNEFEKLSGKKFSTNENDSHMRLVKNWMLGRNLPAPVNSNKLLKILKVDNNNYCLSLWNALLKIDKNNIKQDNDNEGNESLTKTNTLLYGIMFSVICSIAVAYLFLGYIKQDEPSRRLILQVGEKTSLYSLRSFDCGAPAMIFEEAKKQVPKLFTGEISDGGETTRKSSACKTVVPARLVIFEAKTIGVDSLVLQGDTIQIVVKK